ncbi:MAG: sulfur globule protein CV1 [endosymbiont of Seepiophila jonesi]|uniref:Sulfur globule protein CV1 n=1 Tax=endosymbiont of Lamellibrachia luymesi TaxID=2200907 RepID=A0A370DQU3_9GAMM|nr:MAG: sulfur globule protein CV1 [endosymbiont of Lamellibrachia luymesi]RDH93856.1 MAG: sulfur globule protein CV1 [endosymbiont of Seepiophila jonesi]
MKKIIAIAALIASTQANAFWGFNDNGYNDGMFDGFGDGDMAFNMSFSGKARSSAHTTARGYGYDAPYYYGYAPYGAPYAPVAPVAPAAPEAAK